MPINRLYIIWIVIDNWGMMELVIRFDLGICHNSSDVHNSSVCHMDSYAQLGDDAFRLGVVRLRAIVAIN